VGETAAAEPVARPVAKPEPVAKTEPKAPAKTEPKAPAKTEPKAKPRKPEPEPEIEPRPEPEPQPEIEPEPLGPLTQKKPLYRRWTLWAGAAGAAAAAAGYFAWDTAKAEDEADRLAADSGGHTYEELLAVEDRGKRSALLTNVFVGTGAALALTSAVMAFWPDSDRPASARSSVRVQVGRSSVGVAVDF
jgi:outer membrane biosynthesis protein TonB